MSGHGNGGHAPNSVPPKWSRRILGAFFAGCVILVILQFVIHPHVYHPWENIPAFHALWGFLGLAFLIQASKLLRRVVMRPEDYYEDPPLPDGPGAAAGSGEGGHHAG